MKTYGGRDYKLFQQDGATCHTSKHTKSFLTDQKIRMMEHPAASPDMSPIEHIWPSLKNKVWKEKIEEKAKGNKLTKDMIWEITQEHLYSREIKSIIKKCYDSMPDRVAELIKNKGKHTSY